MIGRFLFAVALLVILACPVGATDVVAHPDKPPFTCPEALPDDEAQAAEMRKFMAWMRAHHGDWTVGQVLEFRYGLLVRHQCVETLRAIDARKP